MIGNKSKAKVEEKDREDDDGPDRSEILGNLVKVAVLIWSASLLTFSYVRLPNGQKILDFDPTFIASVFSGSLACLLYTSPSPRDKRQSRMPSSA